MNKVIVKFLSWISFALVASNFAFADFTQKQVRYMSYIDLVTHLKTIIPNNHDCFVNNKTNGATYGYSSPISGKPLSESPNFDFLTKYISCVKRLDNYAFFQNTLSQTLQQDIGNLSDSIDSLDESVLYRAIDELILKLIGPETVLLSYGLVGSQEELRKLLHESALTQFPENEFKTRASYLNKILILIHLRDEFLSY